MICICVLQSLHEDSSQRDKEAILQTCMQMAREDVKPVEHIQNEAAQQAARFLEQAPRQNHLTVCQYISMCQQRNENHYQSHRDKLYYVADQTLKLEQRHAREQDEITADMLDMRKLEEYLRHADPNSEEYLVLMELLAQERAKGHDIQMNADAAG